MDLLDHANENKQDRQFLDDWPPAVREVPPPAPRSRWRFRGGRPGFAIVSRATSTLVHLGVFGHGRLPYLDQFGVSAFYREFEPDHDAPTHAAS